MTVTHVQYGYLEDPNGYLVDGYLGGVILGYMGFQATAIIEKQRALGMQASAQIVDHLRAQGQQGTGHINDHLKPMGMQALIVITDHLKAMGEQADGHIIDHLTPKGQQAAANITPATPTAYGMQAQKIIEARRAIGQQVFAQKVTDTPKGQQATGHINDHLKPMGMSAKADKLSHTKCPKYLVYDYLTDSYLAGCMDAWLGMQGKFVILHQTPQGQQGKGVIEHQKTIGQEAEGHINNHLRALGMQALSVQTYQNGMQATIIIYNTTNLRMLCEFVSRGIGSSNWVASSTEAGDYLVENLDSDIIEQIWRTQTGVVTSVNLTNDTGVPQGVAVDTIFIGNHNFTSSAQVTVLGADNPSFSPVGVSIPMQWTEDNMYYIAPEFPLTTWRYWRFVIDDATNPDNFISAGVVLFGTTDLFHGEDIVDHIRFGFQDFVDKIPTEGYTNVSNSRTIKKQLGLEFRSLRYQNRNFALLREHITRYRTTHKCLWIPTPDPTDQKITARYAVFGKLVSLPSESHNSKGANDTYVDLTLDIDESL